MLTIGIGEIQKNTAIFSNLTEAIQIVDKRKNKNLAVVYPILPNSIIDGLAGKYKKQVKSSNLDYQQIKEQAMQELMEDKYGLPS